MAFRGGGGGHSPGAVRVGRGSGRGNVSGRRGVGRSGANISTAADHTPRSPGSRRARPPEAMPTVTAPVPDPSSSTGKLQALVTSLGSDATVDDIKEYFETLCEALCEDNIEVSCVTKLGRGKAELILSGISSSELEEMKKCSHVINEVKVEVDFQQVSREEPPSPVRESEDESKDSCVKIEVKNLPSSMKTSVVKKFFELPKSGGFDGAVTDVSITEPGVFQITFCDHNVAEKVVSKSHIYKKNELKVKWVEEEVSLSDIEGSDSEDEPNQIEVHNVPETVKEDVMTAYFETEKSSGSRGAVSGCEKMDNGVFIVTFYDPKVAAQVMSQPKHVFKKATLSLELIKKKKDSRKMNQLLIRGLPGGTKGDVYEVRLGGLLGMDEEEDFDLAINDDTTAVITFTESYSKSELQEKMDKISSSDANITVEIITASKPSIHIYNISGGMCDEDLLNVYFGKSKNGGGRVESVQILGDSGAIVTFADAAVVQSVLKKKHPALGPNAILEVSGSATVGSDQLDMAPEPLEIPINPQLIQSISQNPNLLEQSLTKSEVTFSADEDKGMLVLSPVGRPKANWRQEYKKLAKNALDDLSSELVIETTTEFLSPKNFKFLQQIKQREFPTNVEVTFDASMFSMVLKGPKRSIESLKESMVDIVSHAETIVVLSLPVIEFFSTPTGTSKLEKFLHERECNAAIHFAQHPAPSLYLLTEQSEANKAKAIVTHLPLFVTSQGIPIPPTVVPIISDLVEFNELCQDTEQKHEVLIKHTGNEVSASGFKEQVSSSLADINAFLTKLASPIPPLEKKVGILVARSLKQNSRGVQKCLKNVYLSLDTAKGILILTPMHYLKPEWEENCWPKVNEYIKQNIVESKVSVSEEASSEILQVLYSATQEDDTLVYHHHPAAKSLSFAGEPNIVKRVEERIAQICANHSSVKEDIPLKGEEFEYFICLKMEDLVNKFHIEIEPVPESYILTLSGSARKVREAKEHIQTVTQSICEFRIGIDQHIIQFLSTEIGRERVLNILREKRSDKCAVYISESPVKLSLVCVQKHKNMTEKVSKVIAERTALQLLKIPDLLVPILPKLPEFASVVSTLEREHPIKVTVEENNIVIAGFKDGVVQVTEHLSSLVQEKMAHFQPVNIPVDPMFAKCMQCNNEGLQACMSTIEVSCKLNPNPKNATVIVYPTKDTKSEWKEECKELLSSYLTKEYLKETIDIPKETAQEVSPILAAASSKPNFTLEYEEAGKSVTIAGEIAEVRKVTEKIHKICVKTQKSEVISLKRREYDYFIQVVQKTITTRAAVKLLQEKHSVKVSGSIIDVTEMVEKLQNSLQCEVVPVLVDEIVVKFFHTEGRKKLQTMIAEGKIKAAIHVDTTVNPHTLELLGEKGSKVTLRSFSGEIPKLMEISTIQLPISLSKPPESRELVEYCKELTGKYHVFIEISKLDVLQICGFKDIVSEVRECVEKFIKMKCTVTVAFSIPKGMWRLLHEHMGDKQTEIDQLCHRNEVKYTQPRANDERFVFKFKGDKTAIENIIEELNSIFQSIQVDTVPLNRPELRDFFKGENGVDKITVIEKKARVCIEMCLLGEDEEWGAEKEYGPTRTVKPAVPKHSKECTAQVGVKRITIHVGDITEFRVEVIVNAANEDLKHIGGVAYSILKKGGQVIQDASDRYVKSRGQLKAGDVWLSSDVGQLPCVALAHAVGPRWKNPSAKQLLKKVVIAILKAAHQYNSIAIPAISSGIFGCPIDECADIMVLTLIEFCKSSNSVPLDDINIVLFSPSDVPHFVRALGKYLPPQSIRMKSDSVMHNTPAYSTFQHSVDPYEGLSEDEEEEEEDEEDEEAEEGTEVLVEEDISVSSLDRIIINQGSILDVEAEIYVNTTNSKMDLTAGAVAQALAKAAGPALQAECTKAAPIAAGEIAVTGPGNINRCRCIIHINCPGYDQSGGHSEMVLRTIMNKCMQECDRSGASTIVFPAIGTGNLGFPIATAAHIMVDEVCNYLQRNKCKSLSVLYFIIFMENMYRTFCDELKIRKGVRLAQARMIKRLPMKPKEIKTRGKRHAEPIPPEPRKESKPPSNHTLNLENGIVVDVVNGDITKENTDVIVNTTNEYMSMASGVSAALANKGGKNFKDACRKVKDSKKKGLARGDIVVTKAGNLRCKHVYHIKFQKDNFIDVVSACIEKVREQKYKSIAFPAIGTGTENFPIHEAAKGMIKGLQQCRPSTELYVKIVLSPRVYRTFLTVVESLNKSWYQRVASGIGSLMVWGLQSSNDEDQEAPMECESLEKFELRIYGETADFVESAKASVFTLISRQFKVEIIDDNRVSFLQKSHERELQRRARDMQLVFRIDHNLNTIELDGNRECIADMKLRIYEVLGQDEREATRKMQADTLKQVVQWKRLDSAGAYVDYDPLQNLELEEHYAHGKKPCKCEDAVSGENFSIDFLKMVEIDHTLGDKEHSVKRFTTGTDDQPDDWEPMTDPTTQKRLKVRVIDLQPDSKGYKFALGEFEKTMTKGSNYTAIVTIERIQNPGLYGQYIAKKRELDSHNPASVQNERWLYHGTNESAISSINQNNFNRSLRGQNGTVHGQGCYFARDASYSNRYSTPGSHGKKRMYLVRVLAGEYTKGANALMVPPPKDPQDPTVPYDSVVDNMSNPSIFVIFYDAHAYPEYLITYT